jgi:hypothetical protein
MTLPMNPLYYEPLVTVDGEEWRPIPGSDYQISSIGRVLHPSGHVIIVSNPPAPGSPSRRSPQIRIRYSDGRQQACSQAALVCAGWHGPCNERWAVNLDNDSSNNTPENVAWMSKSDALRHTIKPGAAERQRGISIVSKGIPRSEVLKLRADYQWWMSRRDLVLRSLILDWISNRAEVYRVPKSMIRDACRGRYEGV